MAEPNNNVGDGMAKAQGFWSYVHKDDEAEMEGFPS
jgi:hypothetical protein